MFLFFYIIFIGYDFFYYYLLPVFITDKKSGLPSNLWYLTYFVLIILIPVSLYLNKVNKISWIKYVFVISYLLTAFIVDIFTFFGSNVSYTNGNVVEIFLIFSLPLFL
ncbi:metal-dependent phosphohydrolase, partial [Neobacillus drentensis]